MVSINITFIIIQLVGFVLKTHTVQELEIKSLEVKLSLSDITAYQQTFTSRGHTYEGLAIKAGIRRLHGSVPLD